MDKVIGSLCCYDAAMLGKLVRTTVSGVLLALAASSLFGCSSEATPEKRPVADQSKPNIVLVLTDDLDARLLQEHLEDYPNLRKLAAEGITFANAFVTNPICCPSRATILRGQYSHNHGVLTNVPPRGGFERFESLGREESTIATWLHGGGYRTVLIGRYLNGKPRGHKPPGWDEFYGGGGGKTGTYTTDYYASKASEFVRSMKGKRKPFFMYLATMAPHAPAKPAPRHANAFPGAQAPRPPAFNEQDISDKPAWIREMDLLTPKQIDEIDELYRKRLQSMLAVDEMIGQLVDALKESGELENTYLVFTSDNGRTMGEHRRQKGKLSAYEEDIRVPLIVRGPGVPEGTMREHLVLNNDFAPTFAELGGVSPPSFVDGHSLTPLLHSNPPPPSDWRSGFLVEGYGNKGGTMPTYKVSAYKAVRTEDHLWVEYAADERELYDLSEDPYELQNLNETAPDALKRALSSRLNKLRDCSREGCRKAEGF
jgi:N-acetylglucosamine-6-sulfatase